MLIDGQLRAAGWHVCDTADLDLPHHPHTAVREVRMKRGHGQVDYLLYVDRRIVGVVEAKPEGKPLSGVEWQSAMYADGLSIAQQLQALKQGTVALDGSKGQRLTFRAWDGQLRQPLLLVHGHGVAELAPLEGFLHPRSTLDTLGYDAPETACKPA